MSPGYLLVHNKLHQVLRDEAATILLCSLIPWSEIQTGARRDGFSFRWCLGPEVGRLKQPRLTGMAEGWNHVDDPRWAPGLAQLAPRTVVLTVAFPCGLGFSQHGGLAPKEAPQE